MCWKLILGIITVVYCMLRYMWMVFQTEALHKQSWSKMVNYNAITTATPYFLKHTTICEYSGFVWPGQFAVTTVLIWDYSTVFCLFFFFWIFFINVNHIIQRVELNTNQKYQLMWCGFMTPLRGSKPRSVRDCSFARHSQTI